MARNIYTLMFSAMKTLALMFLSLIGVVAHGRENIAVASHARFANGVIPAVKAEQLASLNAYLDEFAPAGETPRFRVFMLFSDGNGHRYSVIELCSVALDKKEATLNIAHDWTWLRTTVRGSIGQPDGKRLPVDFAVSGNIIAAVKNWKGHDQHWSVGGQLDFPIVKREAYWVGSGEAVFDGASDGNIAYIALWY